MISIYLAGPYSSDPDGNTREALRFADYLSHKYAIGVFPPHLFHFWDKSFPNSYEFWMDRCISLVTRFDAVYRMAGMSPGADRELVIAKGVNLPIFDNEKSLAKWIDLGCPRYV